MDGWWKTGVTLAEGLDQHTMGLHQHPLGLQQHTLTLHQREHHLNIIFIDSLRCLQSRPLVCIVVCICICAHIYIRGA